MTESLRKFNKENINTTICKRIRLLVSYTTCDTRKISQFSMKVRHGKFLTTAGSISIFHVAIIQLQKSKACNIKNHSENWQLKHCATVSKQMLKHLNLITNVNAIFNKMHVKHIKITHYGIFLLWCLLLIFTCYCVITGNTKTSSTIWMCNVYPW